ncbi:MAG: hypothetical protein HFF84_03355 [Oscillibacter sp.]|nr:hypothetical protein [Oscillibacter sp.]
MRISTNGEVQLPPVKDIRQAVQPGEQLLWWGQPEKGFRLNKTDWLFLILSAGLLIPCVCIFVLAVALPDIRVFILLFSIPYLFTGLCFSVVHLFFKFRRLSKLHYALTDQRILIQKPKRLEAYSIHDLLQKYPILEVKVRRDGSGTIWARRWVLRHRYRIQILFEEIQDVERVHKLIEEQIANI